MKKIGVFLLLAMLVLSFPVLAQSNETEQDSTGDSIDEAYQCLNDLVDSKDLNDLSLQEAIFSTLALGADSKLNSRIEDARDSSCFGESSCTIKETAQALLAYDRINKDSSEIEVWLLEKADTARELTWFLQTDIANHIASSCTITYDDRDHVVNIKDDMTIEQLSAGSCLSRSSSGFWLRVNNECIDKTFRVSCDEDFLTSLLYQRSGSQTIFVSPSTNSASALGTTEETVASKCFKSGSACDYEGTLWAALALDQVGEDVSDHLPYLLALAPDNKRVFPSSFLYALTNGNDQFSEIVQAQQQSKYWQAPATTYNRFYDTALALLALQDSSAPEVSNAQTYLIDIQTPEGCWNSNNIRDTAFLLYSGWPRSVSTDGGGTTTQSCEASGRTCISSLFACGDAGGVELDLDCDFGICCSVSPIAPTCAAQSGLVCSATQTCNGERVPSSDTSQCCLGSCQEVQVTSNACQLAGGGCFDSCTDGEILLPESCGNQGGVCCRQDSSTTGGGNIWIWILILAILIVLALIGIVYRRKLQLWFYRLKNKKKRRGPPGARPPPDRPYGPGALRRPTPPGMRLPPRRGPPHRPARGSRSDKELDETLKKLRDMSK